MNKWNLLFDPSVRAFEHRNWEKPYSVGQRANQMWKMHNPETTNITDKQYITA